MSYERAIEEAFEQFKRTYREPKATFTTDQDLFEVHNSRAGTIVTLGELSFLHVLRALVKGYRTGFDDGWGERSDVVRQDEYERRDPSETNFGEYCV